MAEAPPPSPCPLSPSRWSANSTIHLAYAVLLHMETTATDRDVIRVRLLGHLMSRAPDEVVNAIADDLVRGRSAIAPAVAMELAIFYESHFIRLLRTDRRKTPSTSSHPSNPGFEREKKEVMARLEKAPANHRDAKIRALIRDRYRCVISNTYEYTAKNEIEGYVPGEFLLLTTNCAHIFSASTNVGIDDNPTRRDFAAGAWAVLTRMNGAININIFDNLDGNGVHHLENVLTMEGTLQGFFDDMLFWFDATEQENTYRVCTWNADIQKLLRVRYQVPDTITFTTPDPRNLPVPSPRYLELHALCAKVAHLSGAGAYIRNVLDRVETGPTVVLASDGSDALLLESMLTRLASARIKLYHGGNHISPMFCEFLSFLAWDCRHCFSV